MKFPPMVRFQKGPCRYIVYTWGLKRFPYNYFAAQVLWGPKFFVRIVRGIYGYLGKSKNQTEYRKMEKGNGNWV